MRYGVNRPAVISQVSNPVQAHLAYHDLWLAHLARSHFRPAGLKDNSIGLSLFSRFWHTPDYNVYYSILGIRFRSCPLYHVFCRPLMKITLNLEPIPAIIRTKRGVAPGVDIRTAIDALGCDVVFLVIFGEWASWVAHFTLIFHERISFSSYSLYSGQHCIHHAPGQRPRPASPIP